MPSAARPGRDDTTPEADASPDSTVVILDRAQRGDPKAIQTLISRAAPEVRRWARGRLPRHVRHDANTEDVVQDAVLKTLKNLARVRVRTVGGLQAYLRVSVVNRIRDLIRGTTRHGVPLEIPDTLGVDEPSPLELAIRAQRLSTFLEALARLRPADRQLIVWRVELGYTTDEIAIRLGKSKGAAGMSVGRALDRLARELGVAPAD
jgi:RNA polymerase sigma-70 factor (ECF subfamily)